jgi:cell division protein FtsL
VTPSAPARHAPSRPKTRPTTPPRREAAPRRHLRAVPPAPAKAPPRRRLRPQVALTMALGTFFLVLFGVALLQTVLVQGQIHLDGLRADLAVRQAQAQELRAEVAELSSPANIIEAARGLNLTEPTVTNYVQRTPPEAE